METGINQWLLAIGHLQDDNVQDIKSYSPLTLAYIGDAVYELMIRTLIVGHGNAPVNKLHKRSSQLVKASAQAELIKILEPMLSEEELLELLPPQAASPSTMEHATTGATNFFFINFLSFSAR